MRRDPLLSRSSSVGGALAGILAGLAAWTDLFAPGHVPRRYKSGPSDDARRIGADMWRPFTGADADREAHREPHADHP